MKIKVFDFFCGCGGASCGFRNAGMDIVFGLDCDLDSQRTFQRNLVHPVNGEVPPVKGRPWKLPHYANRGKTSSSRGELASARSCFSTVRTALGKLRITGLLARFDVARSFPQFPRPLLLQPTIWTSERGADLGSGRCQPRPHLPIYRMTQKFPFGTLRTLGHSRSIIGPYSFACHETSTEPNSVLRMCALSAVHEAEHDASGT